ncbi:MAG: sigma-70 family RNA polymerase sigma factor [Acidobacteriota bacterium]
MTPPTGEATLLLQRAAAGDRQAAEDLLPLVYAELRGIAGALFRGERQDHTLQPTALVHEAWLRLVGEHAPAATDKTHFLAIAARAMRRLLVDHARARRTDKRGGDAHRVTLDEASGPRSEPRDVEILAVHQALERLAEIHPRQARIVELRWFGGLTVEEIAELEALTDRSVRRDWSIAKAWLEESLESDPS